MSRLVSASLLVFALWTLGCATDNCDPATGACAGPASAADVEQLRDLVAGYLAEPNNGAAEETLGSILAMGAATVPRLEQILAEPPVRGAEPTGYVENIRIKVSTVSSEYFMWVPDNYAPTQPYPLVVCLHGAASDGSSYLDRWQPRLGDKYILACPTYEFGWWELEAEDLVLGVIADVTKKYNIDPNRIFLSGMSDGGTGTLIIGMHDADRFAGIAPMATGFGPDFEFLYDFLFNFFNTPVYLIHGIQDQYFPVENAELLADELMQHGINTTFREHNETVPGGGGHIFPVSELGPLVQWFDQKTRAPLPTRIDYFRDQAHLGRFFWSQITDVEEIATINFYMGDDLIRQKKFAHLTAEISGNRIDVTTKLVKGYRLLLNDKLIDLSKPVEIYTNGAQSFSGMVTRSAETLLRESRAHNDRAQLFSASVSVQVP